MEKMKLIKVKVADGVDHKKALSLLKKWKEDILMVYPKRDELINLSKFRLAIKDLNSLIRDFEDKIKAPDVYHFSKSQFLHVQDNIQYLNRLLPMKQSDAVLNSIKEIYV